VARDEALQAVGRSRRASQDRLATQETIDVGGELHRRGVTPLAVFLHRLEGDPVEVSSDLLEHGLAVRAARPSSLDRLRVQV
jgi:hypothetical protein